MFHAGASLVIPDCPLNREVIPSHYDLKFAPNLETSKFHGEQVIHLRVNVPTNKIIVNSAELDITSASLTTRCGKKPWPGVVTYDLVDELAIITFPRQILPGEYKLSTSFDGQLNDKLRGFYRSTYKDSSKVEHVLATTQMEPADARRVFPSFDQPSFKATFKISLLVDQAHKALSNGMIISTTKVEGGKKLVRFKKTIKMATYLVAMVVGELSSSKPVVVNGVTIRVHHVPGKEHLTAFTLKSAVKILPYLEELFGIKYPNRKLDLVAVPDFPFGAMENDGCMIFRETLLLLDEQTATIQELMDLLETLAHEMIHTWSGNLATMLSWCGLALNEMNATYLSLKTSNHFYPEWKVFNAYAAMRRAGAFRVDSLLSTHPLEYEVKKASDALGMVDLITYGKGSGLLFQLENFIGPEAFLEGLRGYLKKYAYGNAETTDFWDQFGRFTRRPVRSMMDSWALQPGHPVITVGECSSSGDVRIQQKRFLLCDDAQSETANMVSSGANKSSAKKDGWQVGQWLVPVAIRYKYKDEPGVRVRKVLLRERERTISLGKSVEWLVANAGGTGFFRTRYEVPLTATVPVSDLSVLERYNLVNDTWACVRAGLVSAVDYCTVVKEFAEESDPNVIGLIIGTLGRLLALLPSDARPGFQAFIRKLLSPSLARLGWDERKDESSQDKMLRPQVIETLGCAGEDKEVQSKAKELFEQYLTDSSLVSNNVVDALVSIAAYIGGDSEFERLTALYEASKTPQEKIMFLSSLACFKNNELRKKTLQYSLSGAVKTQDLPSLLIQLFGGAIDLEMKQMAWRFVQDNWQHLAELLPETGLIRLISGLESFDTPELAVEVRAFLASLTVRGGASQVAQTLESLNLNLKLRERVEGETDSLKALFTAA
jgi:puromycin-sensitive aminopeptidase